MPPWRILLLIFLILAAVVVILIVVLVKGWSLYSRVPICITGRARNRSLVPRQLKMATFNTFLCRMCGAPDLPQRMGRIITEVLPRYDILCLQEVFCQMSYQCHTLMDLATTKGFDVHKSPAYIQQTSALYDGGLVTLSGYPLIHREHESFQFSEGTDQLADKGMLYSVVQISPQHKLHIINVHLQSDPDGERIRSLQLTQIQQFITQRNLKQETTILMGDFNVNAYHLAEYQHMLECLELQPSHDLLSALPERPFTFFETSSQVAQSLDYMFFWSPSDWLRVTQKERIQVIRPQVEAFLSDHALVEVTFEINL